jgi:putative peptide zinc metalloprotease protein
MYCNVSDAYTFQNLRHKFYVTMAGGFVELWIWSVASVIWAFTVPGTSLHDFAFKLIVVSGISTLAFNFNPLLKLDGYYALVDALGVSNLRDNSMAWVRAHVKRNIFRLPVPSEPLSPRIEKIYGIYGYLAVIYSAFMMLVLMSMFWGLLLGRFHLVGIIPFFLLVSTLYGGMARKSIGFVRDFCREKEKMFQSNGFRWGSGAFLAVLIGALFAPISTAVSGTISVDTPFRLYARPLTSGKLKALQVQEGQSVSKGQPLAVLQNIDLENAYEENEVRIFEAEAQRAQATSTGDSVGLSTYDQKLLSLQGKRDRLKGELDRLTVRAPSAGMVTTPRLHFKIGQAIAAGSALIELAPSTAYIAHLNLPENDLADVKQGQSDKMILRAFPGKAFEGQVWTISPIGRGEGSAEMSSTKYMVRLKIDGSHPELRLGMAGEAKILGERRELWRLIVHWASKTLNPDFW